MNLAQNIITNIITEKASIDWNNYLTPDEVEKFLSKDDKVESAEEIIYNTDGDFYKKYFNNFKKEGWHKRDLTQDLAQYYYNGHLNESIFDKNKVKPIQPYLKTIQNNLLPALSKYEIFVSSEPVDITQTMASYSGEANKDRLVIKFYSNSNQLSYYEANDNVLYCDVFLGAGGSSAGVLNLSDINACAEQIYATLYEMGFRTKADIKDEEKKAQEEKLAIEKQKQADKRARQEARAQEELEKAQEPEEKIDASQESLESIEEFNTKFDRYLNELVKIGEMNTRMECTIAMDTSREDSYTLLSIDMTYISPTMCLVETTGIKPKVDKTVTWEQAKNYCTKVAEKVHGYISVTAYDTNNNDIELKDTDDSNDLDLGIDI